MAHCSQGSLAVQQWSQSTLHFLVKSALLVIWPLAVAVISSRSLRSAQARKRVPGFAALSICLRRHLLS
jgi:hypothetical protein